jgi:long-subunit acyl-CoA synthetase (AMP-forming)
MTMVGIPAVWEFIFEGILAEVNKRRVPQEHV